MLRAAADRLTAVGSGTGHKVWIKVQVSDLQDFERFDWWRSGCGSLFDPADAVRSFPSHRVDLIA
jgi:hypothetical protein